MAYREFKNEEYYEAPASTPFDGAAQAISSLFRSVAERDQQRRQAADKFNYDLDKGAFENDQKILTEMAKNVTDRTRQEIRTIGRPSLETERQMKDGLGWQQMSKIQFDRAKALRADIASKKDTYYNPEPDEKLVTWATHGEGDEEVDFRTRGERLKQAEEKMGGVETFRFDKYRADYVKEIGTQYKKIETPLRTGGSKTIYNQRTFWDRVSGKPGVTDDQAIRFIESDRRVAQYYDSRVTSELDSEIKKMKASGDERVSWMKGMKDDEIKNELINNPSKNIINNKPYGVRVRDNAKNDLEEADRINSEVSYTNIGDKNNSGGRWSNTNILHTDAVNSYAQRAKSTSTGQISDVTTFGPGGRFTQKNGRPLQLDTTNPIRTDINRGITTRDNKGSVKLNMTGYQLMPVKKGMAPYVLKSPDTDGMIEEIKNIPLELFDPNGKTGLQPEMKIGLNGYTINEAAVLGDVNDKLFDIADQMRIANESNDKEKITSLQNLEYSLAEIKDMIGDGEYDQRELLLAANKAGIRKTKEDWIIPADNSDIAAIKNTTGGFDLTDRSFWSEDMKAVETAYKQRYEEAKAQGFGAKKEEPVKQTENIIASDGSDLDKWKPTAQYKVGNSVYYFDKTANEWKKK